MDQMTAGTPKLVQNIGTPDDMDGYKIPTPYVMFLLDEIMNHHLAMLSQAMQSPMASEAHAAATYKAQGAQEMVEQILLALPEKQQMYVRKRFQELVAAQYRLAFHFKQPDEGDI